MRFHRFFAAVVAVFLLVPISRAEEKPNTLTPKEAAEGWLLLFDGETAFGWIPDYREKFEQRNRQEPTVKDGTLIVAGGEKSRASLFPTALLGDYELRFDLRRHGDSKATLGVQVIGYPATGGDNSATSFSAVNQLCPENGDWKTITVTATAGTNNTYSYRINDREPHFTRPNPKVVMGNVSRLDVEVEPGGKVELRNVKVKPAGLNPIFNGKDLTGWKVFPGEKYKSVYTVTPAGEINVKNGPGDLQTTKKYDNFCLQLDCKTNGKALNSGIFYRCIADQYQNGYECQVHNGFKDDDRTKPADGGTGAIYRRQPARKIVANDNEWFTMTLVAAGPRYRSWVNGWPTADWVDERKPNANPRNGLRLEAGHLSIQGHDPTTDILFRNLKLAELPAPK